MKRRLIKKLIVLHSLQLVLHEIFQEENWEYCCYKEEVQDASPIQYIDEILLIGRSQLKTSKQIKALKIAVEVGLVVGMIPAITPS